MTDLLIGLDVGTTAAKALLFDARGRVLASATRGYRLITPQPGWVEQDPEDLWGAVVEVLRELSGQAAEHGRIVALCQSSQGGTTIPVDGSGRPLANAFSWMDQRAVEEAAAVEASWGAEFIRTTTGWPLGSGLPLPHIAWFRRHRPQEFASSQYFLFVNDFIGYRLTGELCMDPSDASITQLMDLATGDWDNRLLASAGIRREQLSPIRPSGTVVGKLTTEAARATGLPPDTLLVNGAHDQYCAAVGTGVTQPGRVLLSCGTAWVLLAVPATLQAGLASGMAVSRHAVEGRWGAIRSLGGVGASLEWLADQVWGGAGATTSREALYEQINAAAMRVSSGSDGVLFLPLAGGHAGGYGPARGGFLNLSLRHRRDHLARAVMEGTVFELRWAADEIRAAGIEIARLSMVGGAAKSSLWPQIVADVVGVPVAVPALADAAALGAAILAAVGVGLLRDAEKGAVAWQVPERLLVPVPAARTALDSAYEAYRKAVRALAA